MKALTLVLVLALTGCATPHPPIGIMWATIATVDDRPVLVGYAPARPACEHLRNEAIRASARRDTWGDCELRSAVPYKNDVGDSTSTYWTVAISDSLWAFPSLWHFRRAAEVAALGSSDQGLCRVVRTAALQRHFTSVGECERIVVTPLR